MSTSWASFGPVEVLYGNSSFQMSTIVPQEQEYHGKNNSRLIIQTYINSIKFIDKGFKGNYTPTHNHCFNTRNYHILLDLTNDQNILFLTNAA